MAQRAAGFGKKPIAPRPSHAASTRMAVDLATAIRVVPLDLAPLIAPYRKKGRVSLRIERMGRRARFSAGHNNGDGSWSLATDELDDLQYMLPEDAPEAHLLAVRIIALEDASTLAVLEVPIAAFDLEDEDEDNFAGVSSDLLARGRKSAPANVNGGKVEPLVSKGDAAPSLLVQPGHEERMLAEAVAARQQAERDLHQAREECEALKSTLNAREAELLRLRIASEAELAGLRSANEQALESLRRAIEDSRNRPDPKNDAATRELDHEVGRLRGQIAAMQSTLSEREAAAARLQSSLAEREGVTARLQATLAERDEALRRAQGALAEREQAAGRVPAAVADRDAAQKERDAAQKERDAALKEREAALKERDAAVRERDAAVAKARAAVDEIRDKARAETDAAVASAERAWKAREEARFAANERLWREQSAKELAAAMAHCDRTEAALKDARAQAERAVLSAGSQASDDVRRLREEASGARTALYEREAELEQLRAALVQERESWRLERDAAISKAHTAWKAEEAGRLAAAEAQWLEKTKKALAAARSEAESDSGAQRELQRLRAELAATHAKLVQREKAQMPREPAPIHRPQVVEPLYDAPPMGSERIVLRTDRGWEDDKPSVKKPRPWQHYLRDAAFVAVVAAGAFLLYPIYGSGTFDQLRTKISMMVTNSEDASAGPAAPAPAPAHALPPPAPVLPHATALHNANVRATPSISGAVVTTLPHGTSAQVVKTQGNWTEVQTADGKTGWVYSTFLKSGDAAKTN